MTTKKTAGASPDQETKVVTITSRDNAQLVRARKLLSDAAFARREGVCWMEGDHLCSAALARGLQPLQAFITDDAWEALGPGSGPNPTVNALRALALHAGAIFIVPTQLWASVVALESPAPLAFVLPLPSAPAIDTQAPTIVLDRVQDPGNVGSILRSASAFGFHQIIALTGTASLWSAKVMRAGMGAHFALHLHEHAKASVLDAMKLPLLGSSSHADEVLGSKPLPRKCVWLVGHEGRGLDAALLKRCERVVRIAQPGGEESLNAAVAAAICMHASLRDS
jgi:RNA methyltransferase, TrmH family